MKKDEARKKSTAPVKSDGNGAEKSYAAWIADLKRRYRATQIKAAVAVNSALIEFYWNLGKDIAEKFAEEARYGSRFFEKVSFDMRAEFPKLLVFRRTDFATSCCKIYLKQTAYIKNATGCCKIQLPASYG